MIYKLAQKKKISGFTLAELLIALAILGVIATFTIPKVLQSQNNAQQNAIFKEIIAMESTIITEGVLSSDIPSVISGSDFRTYVYGRINAIKTCTDSVAQGCWSHTFDTSTGAPDIRTASGFTLANGASVLEAYDPDNNGHFYLFIDYNGPSGPNQANQDQLFLGVYYDNRHGLKPGTIQPWFSSSTLYYEIFN